MYVFAWEQACGYVHVCVHVYVVAWVQVCVWLCVHACRCTCVSVHVFVCACTCLHMRVCECMRVSVHEYVCAEGCGRRPNGVRPWRHLSIMPGHWDLRRGVATRAAEPDYTLARSGVA